MNVVWNPRELEQYLKEATILSPDHPIVISKFIENAKELEIDGVAQRGEIVVSAISEHIETAGVHSGDATIALSPQRLYALSRDDPESQRNCRFHRQSPRDLWPLQYPIHRERQPAPSHRVQPQGLPLAPLFLQCLAEIDPARLPVRSWREFGIAS